jgi:uncharacterized coiled-coil protein SlyX|tara:strand:+ start:4351 stop:4695 length:345 start_codon:yes stop_codon:yes gene_type:complete
MITIILVILLILSIGVSVFFYFSLKKALERIDLLESELDTIEKLNTELSKWVIDFRKLVSNVYKKLKSVDERGMFEKDDDVGFLFQEMLSIVEECNKRITDNDDNISDEEQNKK